MPVLRQWSTRMLFLVTAAHLAATYSALAWERDVHYELTRWLAAKAGMSLSDAEEVAAGNQSYDDSSHNAAVPSMVWMLLSGDVHTARDVQVKHFPSGARLPSPPAVRRVSPGSYAARYAVSAAIGKSESATALLTLGEALHPFQDSWSHAGVPDTPMRPARELSPELSFSHPKDRGGWNSHNADKTHLHVDEIGTVARETYDALLRFLTNNPRYVRRAPESWSKLVTPVREFALAKSKGDKKNWAKTYVISGLRQPAQMMISASSELDTSLITLRPPRSIQHADVPQVLVDRAAAFLTAWVVQQNIAKAAEYVDSARLREQFAEGPWLTGSADGAEGDGIAVQRWSRKFLASYLVEDHDIVNELGHGDPNAEGYSQLPEFARGIPSTFQVRPVSMLQYPCATDFVPVASNTLATRFAMAVQFSDQQYDAIGIVWEYHDGVWNIVRLLSVVG